MEMEVSSFNIGKRSTLHMGNESTSTPSKSEKASTPPPKEQPPIYPYPDWSALQAYYGPGMMPPPYYSAPPGHAPQPYMWAPQPIMPPYGAPFMYPHGGAYSHHPAMPFVPQHTSTESPAKSATEKDNKSTLRKQKEVNRFAMSAVNGVTEKTSSEESDDRKNETGVSVTQKRKQSSADEQLSDPKLSKRASSWKDGEASGPSKVTSEIGEIVVKPLTTLPPYCSAPGANPTASAVSNGTIPPSRNAVTDLWYKDEKEIKREKRKQSNRESARRSRLRKQAETEELAMRVESLTAENSTLKSKIGRLSQDSEKLKTENTVLQEKLKKARASSVVVENFLSMIDKNANSSANLEAQDNNNTNTNTANGKLHQLLDPARRTDAVAAS